jgi:predicted transcriptional regulator
MRWAEAQQRDRTFILHEAMDHYLAIQEYHAGPVAEGLRDAEAENFVPHEDVRRDLDAERASRKSKISPGKSSQPKRQAGDLAAYLYERSPCRSRPGGRCNL